MTLTTYQATKVTRATPRALLAGGLAVIMVGFALAVGWGNVLGIGGIGPIIAGIVVLALVVWGVSWRGVLVSVGRRPLRRIAPPRPGREGPDSRTGQVNG